MGSCLGVFRRRLEAIWCLARRLASRTLPPAHDDSALRVQREELHLLQMRTPLYAGVSVGTVVALVAGFWPCFTAATWVVCLAIPLLYVLMLRQTARWKQGGNSGLFLWQSVVLLAMISSCWGSLLLLLMPSAQAPASNLIVGIMVALVSSPMATTPFPAAVAFWLPSAVIGALIVLVFEPARDPVLAMCYLVYAVFTLFAAALLNRSMRERAVGRIVLEKQNQTIGMFLRDYAENASDWLWETDRRLLLRRISPRLAEVARTTRPGLDGTPILAVLNGGGDSDGGAEIGRLLSERLAFRNVVVAVEIAGETRWWSLTGRPVIGRDATFDGYKGIGSDVTEIRRSEQRVQYLALHDSLTGLSNRQAFLDHLQRACERSRGARPSSPGSDPRQGPLVALLLLDLDRFKSVNDAFGHAVGDSVLSAVAERLRGCLRQDAVVARLGGDEFGVMLAAPDRMAALSVCQRLIDALNDEYRIAGSAHAIGASLGMGLLDPAQAEPTYWLRCADLALYAAKNAGRGVFRVFRPEMIADHDGRLSLRTDLKSAIDDVRLRLVYQPIFDSQTGAIVCVEALCRWEHPSLGPIPPSRFIRLAEEAGLIGQLGAWALGAACRTAAAWPDGIRLAVNVSPLQLRDGEFERVVRRALAESGLAPERLELELTESAYLEASKRTLHTLQSLRDRGTRIVLDDFCTGYSALSYIASFQCDGIKIDKSFIHELESNVSKAAVVRAIGQLAGDLDIPVTAEGVETAEQLAAVRQLAITQAQGYLLQRPTSAEMVMTQIMRQHAAALSGRGIETAEAAP